MKKILFSILMLILVAGVNAQHDNLKNGDYIKVFANYSNEIFISYEGHLTRIATNEVEMDVSKTCNLDINQKSYSKSCSDIVPSEHTILKREFIYNITKLNPPN